MLRRIRNLHRLAQRRTRIGELPCRSGSVLVARLSPVQQLADDVGREAAPGEKSCLPDASGCISRRLAEAAGPDHFRALQFRLAQTLGIGSIEREAMLGELTADAQVAESLLPREDPGLNEALFAQILACGKPIEECIDPGLKRRRDSTLDEACRCRRIFLRIGFDVMPGNDEQLASQLAAAVFALGEPAQRTRLQ
jgi:hypothetical protein